MCTKAMDDGAIVDSAVEFAIMAIEASGRDRPYLLRRADLRPQTWVDIDYVQLGLSHNCAMTSALTPEQLEVLYLARDGRLNGWTTVRPDVQRELALLERMYLIVAVDGGYRLTDRGARCIERTNGA